MKEKTAEINGIAATGGCCWNRPTGMYLCVPAFSLESEINAKRKFKLRIKFATNDLPWCGKCSCMCILYVRLVNSVLMDTLSRSICSISNVHQLRKEMHSVKKIEIRMVCLSDLNGTKNTEFHAEERSLKRWWMHTELHGALQQQQQLQITKNYKTHVNRIASASMHR